MPVLDLPLRLDHAAVSGDAVLTAEAEGALWVLPATADLAESGVVPNPFDELRIEFKTEASAILFAPRLQADPVNDTRRNWYSKIAVEPGEWTTARFDLRLDDDGIFFSRKPMDRQTLTAAMPGAQTVTGRIPRGHRPQPGPSFLVRQGLRSTAAWRVTTERGIYLVAINRTGLPPAVAGGGPKRNSWSAVSLGPDDSRASPANTDCPFRAARCTVRGCDPTNGSP